MAKGAQTLASWYMNQANMLMPTIDLNAGRPVWIITLKSFEIPKKFVTRKEKLYETYSNNILY